MRGCFPHFVRHRGHIKFNAEPNCTLVFVESGCLFMCGGDDLLNERGRDLESLSSPAS